MKGIKTYHEVNCPVCNSNDRESLDYLRKRTSESKLGLCKKCGTVYYTPIPDVKELNRYYENDYKAAVNNTQLITTNRKIEYHKVMLQDILKKAEESGKTLKVLDFGSAHGQTLAWLKSLGHEVTGIEKIKGYVQWSRDYYGVRTYNDITEIADFEKFDLIICYRVLEHLPNPNEVLKQLNDRLEDDGFLYLSAPWLGTILQNLSGGTAVVDFATAMFPEEHLTVFTGNTMEEMLWKAGFICKNVNILLHPKSVIAIKAQAGDRFEMDTVNWEDIKKRIDLMNKATALKNAGRFDDALGTYRLFPEAYNQLCVAQKLPYSTQQTIISKGLDDMPTSSDLAAQYGFNAYRFYKIEDALAWFTYAHAIRPGNDSLMFHVGMCYLELKEYDMAVDWFEKSIAINPEMLSEITAWIGKAYTEKSKYL